jgi:serine/threonine-protein kinase
MARGVAEAGPPATGSNIVHRDIKPDNILIERESGRAVVTDFGIARAIERAADDNSVTSTGFTLGTPTYMSPEQAGAERDLDGRSDIYSLGCVLYEMLAGAPPFTGASVRSIIARHMTEPAPDIGIARPDLPTGARVLVGGMLAKSRDARPANAAALIDDIDNYATLVAPAPRRRWQWMVLAAVVILVAVAVLAFALRA